MKTVKGKKNENKSNEQQQTLVVKRYARQDEHENQE